MRRVYCIAWLVPLKPEPPPKQLPSPEMTMEQVLQWRGYASYKVSADAAPGSA